MRFVCRFVLKVACGAFHTVILSEAGSLFTFGAGAQLGIGAIAATGRGDRALPCCLQDLSRRARMRAVACGLNFTLALTHRGNVFAWGDNESGQLGVGDRRHRFVPTLVSEWEKKRVNRSIEGCERE